MPYTKNLQANCNQISGCDNHEPASTSGTRIVCSPSRFSSDTKRKFSLKLRSALLRAGYSPTSSTSLAREFRLRSNGLHLSISAAQKWLHGYAIPTADKLEVLSQWLGVSSEWLLSSDSTFEEQPVPAAVLTEKEAEILRFILGIDENQRQQVLSLLSSRAR